MAAVSASTEYNDGRGSDSMCREHETSTSPSAGSGERRRSARPRQRSSRLQAFGHSAASRDSSGAASAAASCGASGDGGLVGTPLKMPLEALEAKRSHGSMVPQLGALAAMSTSVQQRGGEEGAAGLSGRRLASPRDDPVADVPVIAEPKPRTMLQRGMLGSSVRRAISMPETPTSPVRRNNGSSLSRQITADGTVTLPSPNQLHAIAAMGRKRVRGASPMNGMARGVTPGTPSMSRRVLNWGSSPGTEAWASQTVCKRGWYTRGLPFLLLCLGLSMTAVITNNEAETRATHRVEDTHRTWRDFTGAQLSNSLTRVLTEPSRALKAMRANMMWLPVEEFEDPGVGIDPWLKTLVLSGSSRSGIVASMFSRVVSMDQVQGVEQALSNRYNRSVSVSLPPSSSVVGGATDALTVTHVQPFDLGALLLGKNFNDFPSFASLVAGASTLSEPLASFPLSAETGLQDVLAAAGSVTGDTLSAAVLVKAAVHRAPAEVSAAMRSPTAGMSEVVTQYQSQLSSMSEMAGTLSYVFDPVEAFDTALNATIHGTDNTASTPTKRTTVVLVEDVSAIESHRSTAARARLASGWLSEPELDEYEATRLDCAAGGILVWSSMGRDNHETACELVRSADESLYIRKMFNYHGRLWVFHLARQVENIEGTKLQPEEAEVITLMWIIGAAVSLSVMLAAFLSVENLLGHTKQEKERGLRQAAEAARVAHEETVSYACHELRNPLHVVSATIEFLQKDLAELQETCGVPSVATQLQSILSDVRTVGRSGRLMQTVVDDLLDYARLRHGQLELVPTAVNLGSLVAGLVEEHHTMAAVPLTVSIADDVPEVCYMDELRLRQVLQNGLTNACKYVAEGDISVRMSVVSELAGAIDKSNLSKPKRSSVLGVAAIKRQIAQADRNKVAPVDLASSDIRKSSDLPREVLPPSTSGEGGRNVDYVLVEVVDTGPGLRGVDTETLFTPFEQGKGARHMRREDEEARKSRSKAGTGLGLAIAYQLVRLMGGDLGLEDRKDRIGARFWFKLPISRSADVQAAGAPGVRDRSGSDSSRRHQVRHGDTLPALATLSTSLRDSESQAASAHDQAARPRVRRHSDDATAVSINPAAQERRETASDGLSEDGSVSIAPLDTAALVSSEILAGHHVIIVDDERLNRRVASRFIRALGATSAELSDGDEVEQYLLNHHPDAFTAKSGQVSLEGTRLDAILLDIQMKRSRGDEVVAELRHKGLRAPVIACTGNAGAHDITRYRAAGFDAVLTKPFSLADLATVLIQAVSIAKLNQVRRGPSVECSG